MDRLAAPPRWFLPALWAAAAAFFAFAQYATWRQWLGGAVRGDAVQTFDMMLSRWAAGEGMMHQRSGNHFFSNHAMLWLYPAGLLYKLHDNIWTYLTILNAGLATAVVPLGAFAFAMVREARAALLVCALFAAGNLTGSLRLSVHPESLVPGPWFLLFLGTARLAEGDRRRGIGCIAAAMALLCCIKEDQPVWLAMFFAWAWWTMPAERRVWGWCLGVSAAAFAALKGMMAMAPRPGIDLEVGFWWVTRYGAEADSLGGLAWWFLTHPGEVARRVLLNPTWLRIAMAGGLVCLLGWRAMLLCVPPALLLFPAKPGDPFHTAQYYYGYMFIPFALLAAAMALKAAAVPRAAAAWVLAGSIVGNAAMPTLVDGWSQSPAIFPDLRVQQMAVHQALAARPEARAAVHYNANAWAPHGRQVLFLSEKSLAEADLVILAQDQVSADLGRDGTIALLQRLYAPDSEWEVAESIGGIVVLERKGAARGGS